MGFKRESILRLFESYAVIKQEWVGGKDKASAHQTKFNKSPFTVIFYEKQWINNDFYRYKVRVKCNTFIKNKDVYHKLLR